MTTEDHVLNRLDNLYQLMNKKILLFQKHIMSHRYGLAEIEAENILEVKDLIRANQDVLVSVFNLHPTHDYYVN